LQDVNQNKTDYEGHTIGNNVLSVDEFKLLWSQCMNGSENRTSSLSMEEQIDSVKKLLGQKWKYSCIAIYEGSKGIGITILHIEPGTDDEGRLFYFGLLPEERGNSRSALFHHHSLWILKQLGTSFYRGSTHENNIKMQKVFLKNDCSIRTYRIILYISE
jgi:hypothetical protein